MLHYICDGIYIWRRGAIVVGCELKFCLFFLAIMRLFCVLLLHFRLRFLSEIVCFLPRNFRTRFAREMSRFLADGEG